MYNLYKNLQMHTARVGGGGGGGGWVRRSLIYNTSVSEPVSYQHDQNSRF